MRGWNKKAMEINLEQAKTSQCDTSVPAEQEKLISLALLAGSYMLKNGGETYRAEECTRRILMAGNADEIEIFAIPTSMIITVKIGGHYHTRSASVKKRDIDIDMIDRVNTVSRSIYEGTMSVNAAFDYLSPEKRKKTSPYMLGIYSSVSSAAFTLLFGGMPRDMIFAFFAAIVTNVSLKFFQKTTGYTFLSALFGSIVMASLSRVACLIVPEISLSSVITGGIIPMVPGLAMTNAVRDTINGDLVSGSSKAIEALLQAVAIAVGVSIVLAI